MNLIETKVLVAFLFGLIRFTFGIFPIIVYKWLKHGQTNQTDKTVVEIKRNCLNRVIAVVQSFGGGVLFATSFLHMMPAVYQSVEELREFHIIKEDYPYSQLVVSLGFFTVYFAEEISQWLISKTPARPFKKRKKARVSSEISIISNEKRLSLETTKIPDGMAFEVELENENNNRYTEKCEKYIDDKIVKEVGIDNVDESVQTENNEELERVADIGLDTEMAIEIEELMEEEVKTQQQVLRCFLMVLALSLHALFEGLAIGLQRSITNIWYLFTAVSIHSATILFCMGLEVVCLGHSTKSTVLHMGMLSVTSSFGVLIGLAITLTTDLHTKAKSFAVVLLEGLSAGTILYITFFETLSREKERRTYRLMSGISIGAGFTLMALLQCLKIDS